ncbi:hypothetical protein CWN37_25910, partial [Klebsiella pneumoniae]
FGLAENTYDLFVGKTLLHGDVLMWLMKTLLTSRCINQRGAGHPGSFRYYLYYFCLPNLILVRGQVIGLKY